MAKLIVDGVEHHASEGQNLLHACLSLGLSLPYFCWHPSLGSVGACRQCAVIQYQDEDDVRGRLTMACMTPVSDGARISINAPDARGFRESVIEWLMENHPHDCPVCEEGGECHLQDMTVMTGHTRRRYRGRKRTFDNQYLGPFLNHEMNRCITCYRCVRYYRDYAGGTDLQAFGSRARMYFGRAEDGVLENEFAGNLVEVCPTGVFTDKPFSRTYTRKWDLQSAPSICPGCAVGCNVFAAERYGHLKRIHNRYHGDVNGYFLCDRGRFGLDFVNAADRIRQAGARIEGDLFEPLDPADAQARLVTLIAGGGLAAIGSPRASVETNTALKRLVGEDEFCAGMATAEARNMRLCLDLYAACSARAATLSDVEAADAALVLGEDVLNTAPRLALALRQTVHNEALSLAAEAAIPQWQDAGVRGHAQGRRSPLFLATMLPTRIDDAASRCIHGTPESLAETGFAIAAAIADDTAPGGHDSTDFVHAAAAALRAADRPLVVSGTGTGSPHVIEAAAAIVRALEQADRSPSVALVAPEANSFGCSLIGEGCSLTQMLERCATGEISTLIVAENDLFRRAPADLVERALDGVDALVVIDSHDTPTASRADLVLPAATFAEATGTFINYETRAQRFFSVFEAPGDIAPAWRWLSHAAARAGRNDLRWEQADDAINAAREIPGLQSMAAAAPGAGYRSPVGQKVPRATHRVSGRTAMRAHVSVHEPMTAEDPDTPFAFSMEGVNSRHPAALVPYVWAPGWNSNQAVFRFQEEVGGAAAGGNPGVHVLTAGPGGPWPTRSRSAPSPERPGYRLLPVARIFGSDELTGRSPAIAERADPACIVLNPEDAARLGVGAGDGVRCATLNASFAVLLEPAMSPGCAGVTLGLGDTGCWLPAEPVALGHDPDFRPHPGSPRQVIARG